MGTDYSKHLTNTPQRQPIFGREKEMKKNAAGGYVFQVDRMKQLDRFLILGTEGGTYYATEKEITVKNARNLLTCIRKNGLETVHRIIEVSTQRLAPKNDPAIFALALACIHGDVATKRSARDGIVLVCRTGTHLFSFVQQYKNLGGKWSYGMRRAVSRYYENTSADKLAFQLMKYRQRNGWTHADVIRLAHPRLGEDKAGLAYRTLGKAAPDAQVPANYLAFQELQTLRPGISTATKRAIELVLKYQLPWEALPTEFLNEKRIWEALLPSIGATALLRNLSRLTKIGLITGHGLTETDKAIAARLRAEKGVHPITVLNGMFAYKKGHSERSGDTWTPSKKIVEALSDQFYDSFSQVEPTGANHMLAIDVSPSMGDAGIMGTALTARQAAAAMAMLAVRTEPYTYSTAFASGALIEMGFNKAMSILEVIEMSERAGWSWSGTDCAIPMLAAAQQKIPVDVFVIYTDNETHSGNTHPTQALEHYRQKMGRDAKLITVGCTATSSTIADPTDPRQIDVVGFSLTTPEAIASFVRL